MLYCSTDNIKKLLIMINFFTCIKVKQGINDRQLDNIIYNNSEIMIKFLLAALLISCSLSLDVELKQCISQTSHSAKALQTAFLLNTPNQQIDAIAQVFVKLPQNIQSCLGQGISNTYQSQIPAACITHLDKAAKIGLRLRNEKENQLLFSKDLILLERLFNTKIRKECPFMKDITLQDIKDKGQCLEDAYRLSLVVQKFVGDFNKGDKKAIVSDIDTIITKLPAVLDTCGQTQWADLVRKYTPLNCVHAVEDLLKYLAYAEHHYSHFEWLIRNYKDLLAYVSMVRMHCPLFY